MGVVLLNYILPIMAFSGLDGNYGAFANGHYIAVARTVCGDYFGWALGLVLNCVGGWVGRWVGGCVRVSSSVTTVYKFLLHKKKKLC